MPPLQSYGWAVGEQPLGGDASPKPSRPPHNAQSHGWRAMLSAVQSARARREQHISPHRPVRAQPSMPQQQQQQHHHGQLWASQSRPRVSRASLSHVATSGGTAGGALVHQQAAPAPACTATGVPAPEHPPLPVDIAMTHSVGPTIGGAATEPGPMGAPPNATSSVGLGAYDGRVSTAPDVSATTGAALPTTKQPQHTASASSQSSGPHNGATSPSYVAASFTEAAQQQQQQQAWAPAPASLHCVPSASAGDQQHGQAAPRSSPAHSPPTAPASPGLQPVAALGIMLFGTGQHPAVGHVVARLGDSRSHSSSPGHAVGAYGSRRKRVQRSPGKLHICDMPDQAKLTMRQYSCWPHVRGLCR